MGAPGSKGSQGTQGPRYLKNYKSLNFDIVNFQR